MTQNELEIRPMLAEDLPRIAELEAECFPDPWSIGIFESSLHAECSIWLSAWLSGELVGYAGLQVVLDEGCIENIAVDPRHRCCGIGTALLDALLDIGSARALSFITLEVRVGNASAIHLYTSRQFRSLGIRKGYYLQPREDALIMTRYFKEEDNLC